MNNDHRQLIEELERAGATASEISELLPIATKLRTLAGKRLIKPAAAIPGQQKPVLLKPLAVAGIVLIALVALLFSSRQALPDSPLYPVQAFSDNVAVSLRPEYRTTVMMKRARQVRLLVEKQASSGLVLATLADYQALASTYQVKSTNYEAFEYCKDNLQQAAAIAPGSERQAINAALLSLKDV